MRRDRLTRGELVAFVSVFFLSSCLGNENVSENFGGLEKVGGRKLLYRRGLESGLGF